MLSITRLYLLAKRALHARAFGVRFRGTTGFRLSGSLMLHGREMPVSLPAEQGPGIDFINLALDDEYGLRTFADPPRTVLDIGANCGLFSMLAAHYFPSATIHAYEPNPRIFVHTARNLASVGAVAFEAGVGSRAGRATMRDAGESRLARTERLETGEIPIISLAQAVERLGQKVELLKIDCEGAEWDLFEDAAVFEKIECVRMEYHLTDGRSLDDLRAAVRRIRFDIQRLTPNDGFGVAWLSRSA